MIRLTLFLAAGLYAAMLVWGTEKPGLQAEAVTSDTLEDVEIADSGPREPKPAEAIAEDKPEPDVQVSPAAERVLPAAVRAQTAAPNGTGIQPTNALMVVEAVDAPAEAATPAVAREEEETEVLIVTGNSVNMRAGPSISQAIIGNLRRGGRAELLDAETDGWVRVRDVSSGRVGYMAARYLTAAQ